MPALAPRLTTNGTQAPTALYPQAPGVPIAGNQPSLLPTTAPLTAPRLPTVPTPGTFTPPTVGAAPAATPYGSFTAPDPNALASDPSYQFDQAEQLKAQQRSAAARGTLLTGGLQAALARRASDVASTHYGDIFNRALEGYKTNRDTNAQNFGQNLASFNAGTGATLDAGRLGLAGTQANNAAAETHYGDLTDQAMATAGTQNGVAQSEAENFAAAVENARRQNLATTAGTGLPPGRRPLPGEPGWRG